MTAKYTWERFRAEHSKPDNAFETLARRLFAAECGIDSWEIDCPKNCPGIEAQPVKIGGKWRSFQAKFFATPSSGWTKLKNSIRTARKQIEAGNYKLDCLTVYVNWDRPTRKAQNEASQEPSIDEVCEQLASEAGFKIAWRYGDSILEQLNSSDDTAVVKIARQFFSMPAQPKLGKPKSASTSGIHKFHFTNESSISFVERPELTRDLQSLIDSDATFHWHTVTGAAGIGKSRSILEFCRTKLAEDWTWGWLSPSCDFDFRNWQPDRNTLIVVDYAMGRGNQLREVLSDCISARANLLFKVRIIVA